MARRAFAAPFVLVPLGVLLVAPGCTQDFSTFDPTGSGGAGAGTPSTTSSSTDATSSSSSSSSGPGGGEGGSTTTSSGGGEGGVGGQGGTGGTECQNPVDCDDDNPCTTDTCEMNDCVHTPVLDGPLVEDPADCRTITCAAGVVVDVPNDAEDPPDSLPPCTLTICSGGEPTDSLLADKTPCGPAPQVCQGGVCTGCDSDPPDTVEECGPDTACSAPACVGDPGQCAPNFLPANTPLADPTDGDCQDLACTGNSAAPVSVADNTDTPADLPCGDRGCNGGAPTTTTLAEGTACIGEPGVCDGGGTASLNCRTCRNTQAGVTQDAGCSVGNPVCDEAAGGGEGICGDCTEDAHCPGQVCDTVARTCVDCVDDGDCPGEVCDTAADVCVECLDDGDCPGQICDEGPNTCIECIDSGAGATDDGCMDPTPACDGGAACVECQDDADCTGAPEGDDCSVAGGTECGCNMANDCTGSSRGEDCIGVACGCDNVNDCDHAGSAGPNCTGGVCAP